jgi:hypothetical protein
MGYLGHKLQIILTYDYKYENRHYIYGRISKLVGGINFGRIHSAHIINPVCTEVLHATLPDSGGYIELLEKLALLEWDFQEAVTLLVRYPGEARFLQRELWC